MAAGFAPLTSDDPSEVGGYPLRARLGVGGMGRVYLSFTPGGRPLAIKVIRAEHAEDEEFRRRFRAEISMAQQVQGLYTAPVIDADSDAAVPWLATAYVPGLSLRKAVQEHGKLPPETVFRLLAGAAEGLQAIHACNLIHRDLTPANVLLAEDGPRVIDFGIAHAAAATSLTRSGMRVGTPAYMAPEQVQGRPATFATDVFYLGNLTVFAASGHPAFGEGNQDALFYRIKNEDPNWGDCPDEVREIAARCLAKKEDERPQLSQIIEYSREQTHGQTVHWATASWLPEAIATSLTNFVPDQTVLIRDAETRRQTKVKPQTVWQSSVSAKKSTTDSAKDGAAHHQQNTPKATVQKSNSGARNSSKGKALGGIGFAALAIFLLIVLLSGGLKHLGQELADAFDSSSSGGSSSSSRRSAATATSDETTTDSTSTDSTSTETETDTTTSSTESETSTSESSRSSRPDGCATVTQAIANTDFSTNNKSHRVTEFREFASDMDDAFDEASDADVISATSAARWDYRTAANYVESGNTAAYNNMVPTLNSDLHRLRDACSS